jgi:hypothetical protein
MLMRAGGVPARVVTGYLGGIWNRYGEYLYITQSDAHAWAEVWLDGRGWVRVDPTAVVAPGRLTEELDQLLPAAGRVTAAAGCRLWIVNAVQAWQGLNAWWQDEFIGFNFARQLGLLGRLGIKNHDLRIAGAAAGRRRRHLAGIDRLGHASARAAWRRGRPEPQLARAGAKIAAPCRHRAPRTSAHAITPQRVGRAHPELAATLAALARRYARLRYGPAASAAQLEQFRRAVRLRAAAPRRRLSRRVHVAHARQQQRPADEEHSSTRIDKR